jgi:hypothetical protein
MLAEPIASSRILTVIPAAARSASARANCRPTSHCDRDLGVGDRFEHWRVEGVAVVQQLDRVAFDERRAAGPGDCGEKLL